MACLSDVLGMRSDADQTIVNTKLSLLVNGLRQAQINIWAESRLSVACWDELIDSLLATPADIQSVQQTIRFLCRQWILQGYNIPVLPVIYGRAITIRQLADIFSPHFGSISAAQAHIRSMLSRSLPFLRTAWQSKSLGNYLMWSTFDPRRVGPFEFVLPGMGADYLRSALGLPDYGSGTPLLLFEYILPPTTPPKFPTIADAYASDQWVYYFRPAPASETMCGWTMPRDSPVAAPARPEVVHAVVAGNCLVNTLRVLT